MSKKDKIKLTSLGVFLVTIIFCTLTNDPLIQNAAASTGKLGDGFTGAPGEPTCATIGCHSGALSQDPEKFIITDTEGNRLREYKSGETYTLKVRVQTDDATRQRWGFQLTALADGRRAGTLSNEEESTEMLDGSGPTGDRQYIQHKKKTTFAGKPPGEVEWAFKWQAPSSAIGPVTFYLAGVHANNNGTSTGDQVFTDFAVLSPAQLEPPVISEVRRKGKKLIVEGQNFSIGATILMKTETEYEEQATTNDAAEPDKRLVAKKAGRKIEAGQTVMVKVVNPNGMMSAEMSYTRPEE